MGNDRKRQLPTLSVDFRARPSSTEIAVTMSISPVERSRANGAGILDEASQVPIVSAVGDERGLLQQSGGAGIESRRSMDLRCQDQEPNQPRRDGDRSGMTSASLSV